MPNRRSPVPMLFGLALVILGSLAWATTRPSTEPVPAAESGTPIPLGSGSFQRAGGIQGGTLNGAPGSYNPQPAATARPGELESLPLGPKLAAP